ncbi:hypothetical protein [Actinokineospora sp. HUAS TT18]|uniref:hypothetical protein n=1 Tax=Actinokineospora sp. HUAS TT18 TaxID=3447451 RepID=UPI003F520D36
MGGRFHDDGRYLRVGEVLVRCPRCGARAVATRTRVTCTGCGYAKADAPAERVRVRAGGRCSRCGRQVERWAQRWRHLMPREMPVTCPGCGTVSTLAVTAEWVPGVPWVPRYRGLELWLQVPCHGRTLWAFNEEHLDFLERYVAAGLRERVPNRNGSLASRLPSWIKAAKHRDDVVRCLALLRASLG